MVNARLHQLASASAKRSLLNRLDFPRCLHVCIKMASYEGVPADPTALQPMPLQAGTYCHPPSKLATQATPRRDKIVSSVPSIPGASARRSAFRSWCIGTALPRTGETYLGRECLCDLSES